ncbi:MAG TPA: serine hydrolase, partial [Isosphaeraceae bacterium]|nr:serine hydrolase [Isosphaeraceae bacterium]
KKNDKLGSESAMKSPAALRDSKTNPVFAVEGNAVPSYNKMPSRSEWTRPKITQLHLGMKTTGWMQAEIPRELHAVPYVPVIDGQINEEIEVYKKYGIVGGAIERAPGSSGYQPLCLYSFPNYPDGSLRTSVNHLARFLLAYINQGAYGGARILEADTVRFMLTRQNANPPYQGLCWVSLAHDGQPHWFHNGSDPGIRTNMSFRPADGVEAIVFVNRTDVELTKFADRLFEASARF